VNFKLLLVLLRTVTAGMLLPWAQQQIMRDQLWKFRMVSSFV